MTWNSGFVAVYPFMLAAFAGWVIIGRAPAILAMSLMSGSNFVHGVVVVGIDALLDASTVQEQVIGCVADNLFEFVKLLHRPAGRGMKNYLKETS